MRCQSCSVANVVTLLRMAFLPVLWWWALLGRVEWVGLGVMASFLSDILDGLLARRLNQVTKLGARLDSVADSLLLVSSVVWLLMFVPEVLEPRHALVVAVGLGTWLLIIAVGLLRFRRFLTLHLYAGKASGVLGTLFVVDALVFGFNAPMFYLAFGAFTLGNLEGLTLMLTRSEVNEHIGSILRRPPSTPCRGEPGRRQGVGSSLESRSRLAERIGNPLTGCAGGLE